jgi:hypothetical protein
MPVVPNDRPHKVYPRRIVLMLSMDTNFRLFHDTLLDTPAVVIDNIDRDILKRARKVTADTTYG